MQLELRLLPSTEQGVGGGDALRVHSTQQLATRSDGDELASGVTAEAAAQRVHRRAGRAVSTADAFETGEARDVAECGEAHRQPGRAQLLKHNPSVPRIFGVGE